LYAFSHSRPRPCAGTPSDLFPGTLESVVRYDPS
jgi:hypothetical protein